MADFNIYTLGKDGVNVDKSPIHLEDSELRAAQNAIRDLQGYDGAIRKRPGLTRFNTEAANGSILGGIGVPLQDLTPDGERLFFIGRGPSS